MNTSFWASAWDVNLEHFESILNAQNISFKKEYVEGDEGTCFIDGFIYTFNDANDTQKAQDIIDLL